MERRHLRELLFDGRFRLWALPNAGLDAREDVPQLDAAGALAPAAAAAAITILELLGAQLTLEDTSLPSGSVIGGALATSATLRATQELAYSVNDASSGVRLVKLLVDGNQVAENASSPALIEHATTSLTGGFTLNIPRGPSRTITIGYRAYTNDSTYTTTVKAKEIVAAAVRLNISPWPRSRTTMCHSSCSTTPTGTIVLSGRVQGPIPPHGIIVELLVHYQGELEPIRDPRTNSQGYFQLAHPYQFQDAIGDFPFRA